VADDCCRSLNRGSRACNLRSRRLATSGTRSLDDREGWTIAARRSSTVGQSRETQSFALRSSLTWCRRDFEIVSSLINTMD